MSYSFKQKLGAIVYDLPRFLWSIRPSSGHPWVFMRNRDEQLIADGSKTGVQCDWQWTSDLHIAKVFPSLGRALMKRALHDWPIAFGAEPLQHDEKPQVSFVIGHRGMERLPHLLLTVQSIAAQHEVSLECVVVEQSASPEVKGELPPWVRYVHSPLGFADMPYSRAWAFNVGARCARGEVIVLHDNDMLVAADYCRQIIERVRQSYEVINLQRFIFYVTASDSAKALSGEKSLTDCLSESVVQNIGGGGSIAITREAYFAIGGFDESFIGWGGEDNEFWERAQTLKVWPYGHLPFVHLWHHAQTDKFNQRRSTATLLEQRSAISPDARIAELTSREFGKLASD
jgi:N-terminal domain of galactosyltransferase